MCEYYYDELWILISKWWWYDDFKFWRLYPSKLYLLQDFRRLENLNFRWFRDSSKKALSKFLAFEILFPISAAAANFGIFCKFFSSKKLAYFYVKTVDSIYQSPESIRKFKSAADLNNIRKWQKISSFQSCFSKTFCDGVRKTFSIFNPFGADRRTFLLFQGCQTANQDQEFKNEQTKFEECFQPCKVTHNEK